MLQKQATTDLNFFTKYLGYENGPHHERFYNALMKPEIKRFLVIWPPAHGKSTCGTINYPAWCVGNNHDERFIIASQTNQFVKSYIRGIRAVMADQRYTDIFGNLKPEHPDIWTQNELIINRPGSLEKDPTFTALSVNSSIVGRRASQIIVDDPIDEGTANSEGEREKLYHRFTKELIPRLEPEGRILVIMTRWHFADIASKLLEGDEFHVINAPLGYWKIVEPAINEKTKEALWPQKWPLEMLLARKKEIGSIAFENQYQGHPVAYANAVFKEEWLHYWTNVDLAQIDEKLRARYHTLPPRNTLRIVQAWDLAIGENPESDWTVCVTLGADHEGNTYTLDIYRQHIDFPTQVKQVEVQALAWRPEKIAIESVAYQRALPQALRSGNYPIVESTAQQNNKTVRLTSLAPYFENGSLRVNKDQEDLLNEYLQYPKSKHDDILDALQMAHRLVEYLGVFKMIGVTRR